MTPTSTELQSSRLRRWSLTCTLLTSFACSPALHSLPYFTDEIISLTAELAHEQVGEDRKETLDLMKVISVHTQVLLLIHSVRPTTD